MDGPSNGTVYEILKWVGLAFAAGFIGYFGRYLSMLIIDRLRKRKVERTPATESAIKSVSETPPTQDKSETDKLKLEKKRLKLEKKIAKKQGENGSP